MKFQVLMLVGPTLFCVAARAQWEETPAGALLEASSERTFDALVGNDGEFSAASAAGEFSVRVEGEIELGLVTNNDVATIVSSDKDHYYFAVDNGVEHVIVSYENSNINLSISGLEPILVSDDLVFLVDEHGVARFRYGNLFVEDAFHREQEARFELHGSSLSIDIQLDEDAQFPLTIDPLITPASVFPGGAADFYGQGVATGDLNNDGRPDLAIGATGFPAGPGRVDVFFGQANGSLVFGFSVAPPSSEPLRGPDDDCGDAVEIADVIGDSRNELVFSCSDMANAGTTAVGRIFVFRQTSSGGFPPVSTLDLSSPTSFSSGEAVQRGQLVATQGRIAFIQKNSGNISVRTGTGGVLQTIPTGGVVASGTMPQLAPFRVLSSDTSLGYVVAGANVVRVFNPDGSVRASITPTGVSTETYVTGGDFDGDGDDDLLFGRPGNANVNGVTGAGQAFFRRNDNGIFTSTGITLPIDNGSTLQQNKGSAVGAGDLNADGCEDAVVCSAGQVSSRGACVVYGGRRSVSLIDGVLRASLFGEAADAQLGRMPEIAFANFSSSTADNALDLVVGAAHADTFDGHVYVAEGKPSNSAPTPGLFLESDQLNGSLGDGAHTVAIGRLNSDAFDDVLIGAPGALGNRGAVFIWFGGSGTSMNATPDFCMRGPEPQAGLFGAAVAIGRFRGPNHPASIAVGSPQFAEDSDPQNEDQGVVYVFNGPFSGCNLNADGPSPTTIISPLIPGIRFGHALANGADALLPVVLPGTQPPAGVDSLVVGAPGKGGTGLSLVMVIPSDGADATSQLFDSGARTFLGNGTECGGIGSHLAVGKFDGLNARSDVLFGAEECNNGSGKVFLLRSTSDVAFPVEMTTFAFTAEVASRTGPVVRVGNVVGDAADDFLIGAPFFGASNTGRAFLFAGSQTGQPTTAANFGTVTGASTGEAGFAMAGGTDIDNDGVPDFVVGEPRYDETNQANEGRVRTFFGSTGTGVVKRTFESDCAGCNLGSGMAMGDLNNDGFGDIVIAAEDEANGENFEGRAYVIFGQW